MDLVTMSEELSGFTLPASLADVDPFEGPTTVGAVTLTRGPSGASAAGTRAPVPVPCPCSCRCGNDTDKTYSEVESLSAARHLRCAPCAAKEHFGPEWLPTPEQADAPRLGTGDREVVGTRTNSSFVIRTNARDAADEEWDRQIALKLAQERRDAARDRWLNALPARWQMPYNDGEELDPEVTERLARLKAGRAGAHGTSLLCIGQFGSGKTWVAYTYARAAVDQWSLWPQEIRIGTEAEIMEPLALASPWQLTQKADELLNPRLKMLIIDDLGTCASFRDEANRHATYTKVINWMYEHKRALVITTNKGTAEELDRWIGPTAYERLRYMMGPRPVLRGENKRAEVTAQWEAEWQTMRSTIDRD